MNVEDTKQEPRGYVFISYKSETADKAEELQQYIESHGYKCWRAPDSLIKSATQGYTDDIFVAIRNSNCVLCLLSDLALRSKWIRAEVGCALDNCKSLIPCVIEPLSESTKRTDGLFELLKHNEQIIDATEGDKKEDVLLFVAKAFDSEQKRLSRILPAPTVELLGAATLGVPILGKTKPIGDLVKLEDADGDHFVQAKQFADEGRSRSALHELSLIGNQQHPIVAYFVSLLTYEVLGGVSDESLDMVCRAAIDIGCTDAMLTYVELHSWAGSQLFAPHQATECLRLMHKAIEFGNADALELLSEAYRDGGIVSVNINLSERLHNAALAAGSCRALMAEALIKEQREFRERRMTITKQLYEIEDELNKEGLIFLCLLASMNGADANERHRLYAKVEQSAGCVVNKRTGNEYLYCIVVQEASDCAEAKDYPHVVEILESIVDSPANTDGDAEWMLSRYYRNGLGVAKNVIKADQLMARAAEHGNGDAKCELGLKLISSGDVRDNEKGIVFIDEALKLESSYAQFAYGSMLLHGTGLYEKDIRKGIDYITKAAEHDNGDALNMLGVLYRDGLYGIEVDAEKAVGFFKRSVIHRSVDGIENLGTAYLEGEGVEKDAKRGVELLQQAAEMGSGSAACILGSYYAEGDDDVRDAVKAAHFWTIASESEPPDCDAMANLATLYENGDGVPADLRKAEQLYLRASEHGLLEAKELLGMRYFLGFGESPDYEKAYYWLSAAAEASSSLAMRWLGKLYECDEWTGYDVKKSAEWYLKAANAGNADAMYDIAIDYLDGYGADKDLSESEKWLRKAADAGCVEAACTLGTRYAEGTFGGKDKAKAIEWWKKAASQGDHVAARNLWSEIENKKEAHEWLKRSAEAGNVDSMLSMGDECYNGVGCVPDEEEAAEWYKKAMEHGEWFSALHLAKMVDEGEYEEEGKDAHWFIDEAIRLLKIAAEADDDLAMCVLGDAYSHDDFPFESPVDQDIEKAVSWYKKAAERGNARAQFFMGRYLTNELGKAYPSDYSEWEQLLESQDLDDRKIGRNMKKAAAYFELVANGGKSDYLTDAFLRLARINRYFDEVEEAKAYYQKAIDNGSEEAPKELEEYTKSL